MAIKPGTSPSPTPRFNETAIAIGAALLIGFVLATILTGNPFRALRLAYTDYSDVPTAGEAKASTTDAPAPAAKPAASPSATDTKAKG